MEPLDDDELAAVNLALQGWRQGDCVLEPQWFVFRVRPITAVYAVPVEETVDNAESRVHGLMVLTQTCDLVRDARDRPFVEVCPLVKVEETTLREIERGRRPNYAFIPTLAGGCLVADLDRVMTVEKRALVDWVRSQGWTTDAQARQLAQALARKRARVAFPDDFVDFVHPLMKKVSEKHDKQSDEGQGLRALRELRVRAAPSRDADEVTLTLWFIRSDDEPALIKKGWHELLDAWLALVPASGRFVEVDGVVLTLDDLTAREYVESDPLDLDHLTTRGQ